LTYPHFFSQPISGLYTPGIKLRPARAGFRLRRANAQANRAGRPKNAVLLKVPKKSLFFADFRICMFLHAAQCFVIPLKPFTGNGFSKPAHHSFMPPF
jgi:hypothetical protein